MSAEQAKKRTLLAVIGDEDTITGMLLAGIGQIDNDAGEDYKQKNFYVVDAKTTDEQIASCFDHYTIDRDDIAILLINQHLAERIRYKVEDYTAAFPAVLEIPSKDHAYDPEKDSVLKRVKRLFGE
ncbi:H(+)-transporting V1 sector ATPase subunit F [Saccharomycopsis crataegensis]|uniref:V-type proton ATPase subunit F n=1 Tax=Saccharomycopsis crataegensis TaxID=43959 RepID=A0AAV5QHF5_9ASCO|nr:H(+)-transporting V1 sector ATPase subunit F [Saccharomycopsis crataegensis]